MGTVAIIGDVVSTKGFALAGVQVLVADTPTQARAQWRALPDEVQVVVLTPAAASALDDVRNDVAAPLTVVMPQ